MRLVNIIQDITPILGLRRVKKELEQLYRGIKGIDLTEEEQEDFVLKHNQLLKKQTNLFGYNCVLYVIGTGLVLYAVGEISRKIFN